MPGLELAERFRVTEFPTIITARADGSEIDRLVGSPREREILDLLTSAVTGRPELPQLRSLAETEQSVESHGRLGDALVKRGFYAEALTAYRWCLEKGPNADPSGYSRLLKVVVQHIGKLRPKIPAAGEVIEEFRRKAESGLQSQDADAYTRAFTFNEALGDVARNGELFAQLPETSALRCDLYPLAFEGLVQTHNYRAAVMTVDMEAFIGRLYPLHNVASEPPHGADNRLRHTHRIASEAKERAINYTVAAVEASLGVGHLEKAKRLAGRLIEWNGKGDVRVRLLEAADRSSSPSAASFKEWLTAYIVDDTDSQ